MSLKLKTPSLQPYVNNYLVRIPSDLLEQIFGYLDWKDFTNTALTSKRMKRLLCNIRLKKDLIVNEQKLEKLYATIHENPNTNTQSFFQHSARNVIFDYNDTSKAIKVKHIYCLATILHRAKSFIIQQGNTKHNERSIIEVLMNKYKYVKLTVPKDVYLRWISAYDLISNDKKFRVHLTAFPENCFDEELEKSFLYDEEEEEDKETKPVTLGKRALDLIETPPDIKKQKTMLTESVKKIMMDSQNSRPRLKTDSVTFPHPLNKFLNPFDIYNKFSEALPWDSTITHNHKQAIETKVFRPVGKKFVHAILTDANMKYWLLVTEIDVFLPNKKYIDSCSYDMDPTELSRFSIKVTREKNQGRAYSELIIQAGCYQVLVTGGIYGNKDTLLGGFLGSSIPSDSIREYDTCYTLLQPKESKCFYRLLRDYIKPDASYFAGFRSAIFADHGYEGAHPLRYYQDEKPGTANLSVIASKIMCNYVNKKIGKSEVKEYLRLFLKTKLFKDIPNEQLKMIKTVADVEELVKEAKVKIGNYASTILHKLRVMEEAVSDTLDPVDITIFDLENTNDKNTKLRDLVNGGLYDSVKKQNEKTIKSFLSRYGKAGFLMA